MEQSMVKLNCKIAALPSKYRKIVLPAPIMRLVRYRVITPQVTQTIEAITAEFLTTDPRYCEYFEIVKELETDDTGGEKEAEKEEIPQGGEKVETPLQEAAPKKEEPKPDAKEKKETKKRATKKPPAKKRATHKKQASKDNGGNSESSG